MSLESEVNGMKDRIRLLRNKLGLNQTDFGKRIGIKQGSVAGYESGVRTPLDAVITSICREFDVNEEWLRTGAGGEDNMFTKLSEDDRFSLNLGKLSTIENEFIKNGINLLAETDPEKLKVLEEFMKAWLGIK